MSSHPAVGRTLARLSPTTRDRLINNGRRLLGIVADGDGSRPLGVWAAFVDDAARSFATGRIHDVSAPAPVFGEPPVVDHLDLVVVEQVGQDGPSSVLDAIPAEWRALDPAVVAVAAMPPMIPDHVSPLGFDRSTKRRYLSVATVEGAGAATWNGPLPPGQVVETVSAQEMPSLDARPRDWAKRVQRYLGLLDVPALHDDPRRRARILTAAAAAGVPVVAPDTVELGSLLDPALHEAFACIEPRDLLDPHQRELAAFRQWSAAHDGHSIRSTWDRLLCSGGRLGLAPPSVSVIVASNRPDMIDNWAPQIARQTYPDVEVIAVLHGDSFGHADERTIVEHLGDRVSIVRLDSHHVLGEALALGTGRAGGDLVVKWDDDDLYSSGHLADLVRTHEYSGATIVGKACEYVYLSGLDVTVRRAQGPREQFSTTVAGGTLCISRGDLASCGGWRRAPRRVDQLLIADVERSGGECYRAIGFGYVMMRLGTAGHTHTWRVGDEHFLKPANEQRRGLDLDFAAVDAEPELVARWT